MTHHGRRASAIARSQPCTVTGRREHTYTLCCIDARGPENLIAACFARRRSAPSISGTAIRDSGRPARGNLVGEAWFGDAGSGKG